MTREIVDVGVAGNTNTGDTLRDAFIKTNSNFEELYDDVTGLESSKANLSHTHLISQVTGLQTALDAKANISHTHVISDVTGLQAALDGKAATSHTHAISQITGLQGALDAKANVTSLNALDARVVVLEGSSGVVQRYSVPLGFTTHPLADEILLLHVFAENVDFSANWAGSRGRVVTPPDATYSLSIRRNSTPVGSISIATNGTVTFSSSGSIVFAPGDLLEVVGSTTPNTVIANAAFTLLGVIS